MLLKKQRRLDMLEQKREQVDTYVEQFNTAVSAVTTLLNTLTTANEDIDNTVSEIVAYQKELEKTAADLLNAKAKNETVIKNFGALIDTEREVI